MYLMNSTCGLNASPAASASSIFFLIFGERLPAYVYVRHVPHNVDAARNFGVIEGVAQPDLRWVSRLHSKYVHSDRYPDCTTALA